eukprot:TRINITY_DN71870_c0_g1_i1.p8 TRINITY_DN71870_c0_g1~~TRINITY_DN71870_c0_g1_i1.p8  ORF type:complete len:122 (-),score=15.80 TRINITY_DN71870_c0_g1_i1:908-1273(-)
MFLQVKELINDNKQKENEHVKKEFEIVKKERGEAYEIMGKKNDEFITKEELLMNKVNQIRTDVVCDANQRKESENKGIEEEACRYFWKEKNARKVSQRNSEFGLQEGEFGRYQQGKGGVQQ